MGYEQTDYLVHHGILGTKWGVFVVIRTKMVL